MSVQVRSSLVVLTVFTLVTVAKLTSSLPAQEPLPDGVVPGEVLLQFRPGKASQELDGLRSRFEAEVIGRFDHRPDLVHVRVPGSPGNVIIALRNNPNVEFAQFNYTYELAATPNDSLFSEQWGLNQANDVDIGAPEAWGLQTGNQNLVVATLDTGADLSHPDLNGNLVAGWDFSNNTSDVQDQSVNSHGTHVAGIIAARGNNTTGVAGTMWRATVLAIQIFGRDNFFPHCPFSPATSAQIVNAIDFAVANGAKVVNGSFAGSTGEVVADDAVRQAIEDAEDSTLFVFSAGNFREDNDNSGTAKFPCAWNSPNIICVAGVDSSGNI